MADQTVLMEKWGFQLQELYRLALVFYRQNSGKAVHLSYEDNLKLIAFKQQATLGAFDASHAPELGVLDVIGRDRRQYWHMLGDISKEQAMEGFIDLLDRMCSAFRPYVEAVKQNRDETLKEELRRLEKEKLEKEQKEREQQEILEQSYNEEMQRRQLQDALNKQTYQQFKSYAEKQFPGNPEQQAVLIHQLQQEHYQQYIQLHVLGNNGANNNEANSQNAGSGDGIILTAADAANLSVIANDNKTNALAKTAAQQQQQSEDENDYVVIIRPAKMWTRPDIDEFKAEVSAGDGDGVITIGHGDTVTVRVPTNANGKCIFWEFATDNYDIGFGIYFEWSKPVTNEVTVHVSDSDDDNEFADEDYLSTNDDLESGSLAQENSNLENNKTAYKPTISIIVPIYRRECFNEVYVGSHNYPGEGIYLLKFDNSYSIWRSKTLYYRVYYER